MNLGFAILVMISLVVITARYLLFRKSRRKLLKRYYKHLQEQETFLKNFNATPFDDFSAFDFKLGSFSHVSPFPSRIEGEWKYRISLIRSEAEDIITITHEISECALGRVIEKLLNLERPLYMQRKEGERFWVNGKKQKYLVEHVMATFGEVDDLPNKKLKQRLDKEDVESWLNLRI